MIGFEREEEEIVRYYERVQPHDVFGVWGTELLLRLPLRKAERFLAQDHGWTPETWEKSRQKKDHESVVAEMEDYFQIAWEKAVAHHGRYASRSVHYYLAWTWLLDDMELFAYLMDPRNYPNYGCPLLLAVAQKYDMLDLMPSNAIDYEVFMRMAQGQICGGLCNGLCGKGTPGFFRPLPPLTAPPRLVLPKGSAN